MSTVTTTIRVPAELWAAVKRVAQSEDRTANMQILRYIRQGLEREPDGAEGADTTTDEREEDWEKPLKKQDLKYSRWDEEISR